MSAWILSRMIFVTVSIPLRSKTKNMRFNYLKGITNLSLAIAFVTGALLLLNQVYGMRELIKYAFLIFGILGIILNFYTAKYVEKDKEFNLIFWIGIFVSYLAIVVKILHLPYYQFIIIIGAAITGFSYFFNPFAKDDEEEKDKLLDQ